MAGIQTGEREWERERDLAVLFSLGEQIKIDKQTNRQRDSSTDKWTGLTERGAREEREDREGEESEDRGTESNRNHRQRWRI